MGVKITLSVAIYKINKNYAFLNCAGLFYIPKFPSIHAITNQNAKTIVWNEIDKYKYAYYQIKNYLKLFEAVVTSHL